MSNLNIGLITESISKSGFIPLSNIIELLYPLSNNVYLIAGDEGFEYYKSEKRLNPIDIRYNLPFFLNTGITNYISFQLKIAIWIIEKRTNIDILIFFIGGDTLLLPIIASRILRKKVFMLIAGSSVKSLKAQRKTYKKSGVKYLQSITCSLAQKIIVYSNKLIEDYKFERWKDKILIAGEHFLDFTTFTVTTPYPDRPPLIGYIGRLSAEKGIQHFVHALPAILNNKQDLRVIIGGDGQLKESIETTLDAEKITAYVDLPGWISHDNLPKYLNQLQLLVLPSYTEGLPNIMLEAMACGTPVLATPVGAVPDVIVDGKTGFIMENNSPECIAENVMRALEHPELEGVAQRARALVEREFTFERAVERWKSILEEISNDAQ